MSSKRPLSLLCSLINQLFVLVNAINCPWSKRPFFNKIHFFAHNFFEIQLHTSNF